MSGGRFEMSSMPYLSTPGNLLLYQFSCSQCVETFDAKERLKNHISIVHLCYLPYRCSYCQPPGGHYSATVETAQRHQNSWHPNLEPSVFTQFDLKLKMQLKEFMAKSLELSQQRHNFGGKVEEMSPAVEKDSPFQAATNESSSHDSDKLSTSSDSDNNLSLQPKSKCKEEQADSGNETKKPASKSLEKRTKRSRDRTTCAECKLCSSAVLIRDVRRHIWMHHMEPKGQYLCNVCNYACCDRYYMKKHLKERHKSDKMGWTDVTTKYHKEYNMMRMACFQAEPARICHKVTCKVCSESVVMGKETAHIWNAHMDGISPLTCVKCSYGTLLPTTLKKHFLTQHKGSKLQIIDQTDHYSERVMQLREECFYQAEVRENNADQ